MKRVLILQQPSSISPVDHWLSEAESNLQITVITGTASKRSTKDYAQGVRLITVKDYFSEESTADILAFVAEWRPHRIVSNAEKDVLRCAAARSCYGIEGIDASLALKFRDKLRMKRLFESAEIQSAEYIDCQSVDDVREGFEQFGTVVVKPRWGVGSQGVYILDSVTNLNETVKSDPSFLEKLHTHQLIAERYVDGTVFHIDAVLDGADVIFFCPARYLDPPHTFRSKDVVSIMVNEDSSDYARMKQDVKNLAASLPAGHGVSVIHFEMHRQADNQFLAGEVAARLGGGMIKGTIQHSYGVDLSREAYLLSAGVRSASSLVRSPHPPRSIAAGHKLWTTHLPRLDSQRVPRWAGSFWVAENDGVTPWAPAHSADAAGGVIVEGLDECELEQRMTSLD